MKPKPAKKPTQWHDWMGTLFLESVTHVGIQVNPSFLVTTLPPKGDILLIRDSGETWTDEQRQYLPDGIRDCSARHVIGDLKYTESVTEDSFLQLGYYDYRYRKSQNLKRSEVNSFLLSAKAPQASRLKKWGYEATEHAGVYASTSTLLEWMPIISLNELRDEPHNAVVKCFASRLKERQRALATLRKMDIAEDFSAELSRFLTGLWAQWLMGEKMNIQLTPDQVFEIGEVWGDIFLNALPAEEMLAHLTSSQRLMGLKPEEVLSQFNTKEVLSQYNPEDVFSQYKPEELEAYLNKLKSKKQTNGA